MPCRYQICWISDLQTAPNLVIVCRNSSFSVTASEFTSEKDEAPNLPRSGTSVRCHEESLSVIRAQTQDQCDYATGASFADGARESALWIPLPATLGVTATRGTPSRGASRIRAGSSPDFPPPTFAVVPAILGFVPTDSVVMVSTQAVINTNVTKPADAQQCRKDCLPDQPTLSTAHEVPHRERPIDELRREQSSAQPPIAVSPTGL